MLGEIGIVVQGLPSHIVFSRTLEELDGPILAEYRSKKSGGVYVEKWCAQSEDASIHRFLLVRSDQRSIAEFVAKRISMRTLIVDRSDGFGYLIDRVVKETETVDQRVAVSTLNEIPIGYLPRPEAFHEPTLRPYSTRVVQSFLLGEEWTGGLISAVERAYRDACAFLYLWNSHDIPRHTLNYLYRGGYAIRSAFDEFRGQMPLELRAVAVGVSAASPGVFSIEVGSRLAVELAETLHHLDDAASAYRAVHKWATIDLHGSDSLPKHAAQELELLLNKLSLDTSTLAGFSDSTLRIAKLVAAYYRKLEILAKNRQIELLPGFSPSESK